MCGGDFVEVYSDPSQEGRNMESLQVSFYSHNLRTQRKVNWLLCYTLDS